MVGLTKRKAWVLVIIVAAFGTILGVLVSGVAFAVVIAVTLTLINWILVPIYRPRAITKFRSREKELQKSWSKFRVEGMSLTYAEGQWRTVAIILLILTSFAAFVFAIIAVDNVTGFLGPSPTRSPPLSVGTWLVVACAFFGLTFLPAWVFAYIQITKTCHEVTSRGIRKGSPWSKSFFATWDDIESMSYRYMSDSYIIRTSKGTIKMRAGLDGISFFLQLVSENVPTEKTRQAFHPRRRYINW